jgi:hypothetical protein
LLRCWAMTLPFRPVLDHHPGPEHRDERNKDYGIRRLVEPVPTGNVWWTPGINLLDQGPTGHCGGFAAANEAQASPIRVPKVTNDYAHAYYYEIKSRKLDPWGLEDGTSTQAVMNLGRLRGLWRGYAWAFSMGDLRRALQLGPVLCGTTWRTGMFSPNSDGVIRATGADEGGHLWLTTGYTEKYLRYGPCIRIRNSWGKWGLNGSVYLPVEDAASVIFDGDGECAVPVDRAFPPA